MKFFKKKRFSLGRVYAGPEPKPAPEIEPENERPEVSDEPKLYEMKDVYAGPEQMSEPEPRRRARTAEFVCVYAGPDMFDRNKAADLSSNNPFNQPPYPFNNAEEGNDAVITDAPVNDGDLSAGAKTETVICPVCGAQTRAGKFCEDCGSVLPRPESNE